MEKYKENDISNKSKNNNLFGKETDLFKSKTARYLFENDKGIKDIHIMHNSTVEHDENPYFYKSNYINPLFDESEMLIPVEDTIYLLSHGEEEKVNIKKR